MSNLIIPDLSKKYMADVLVANHNIDKMRLFQNNYVPSHATILTDLTVATFGGYVQQNLAGPTIGAALDGGGRAVITWIDLTFTRTSSPTNTIYGYYVIDETGRLLWVERFDTPVVVDTDGIFIKLTPKLTDKSEFLNT
jgi:hypothetical protein